MLERLRKRSKQSHHHFVMVIGDDLPTAQLIVSLLEDAGFEAGIASTPDEALSSIDGDALPSMFLLDFTTPDVQGRQFIETARLRLGRAKVPPMLMLAALESESTAKAMQVDDFLPEPFDNLSLLAHVQGLCGSRSVRAD